MPTREQLIGALRQADAAGDTQAATRFAELIKAQPTDMGIPSTEAAPIADATTGPQGEDRMQFMLDRVAPERQEELRQESFGAPVITGMGSPTAPVFNEQTFRGLLEQETLGPAFNAPELTGIMADTDTGVLKGLGVSMAALSATKPAEMANIIASSSPDISITYNKDSKGKPFPILTNTKTGQTVQVNKPGLSPVDVMQGLGVAAAFTPAGRAATATGAALSAGATETGLQALQAFEGGKFDVSDIAFSTAAGGAFKKIQNLIFDQGASTPAKAQIQERIERGLPDESIDNIESAMKASETSAEAIEFIRTQFKPDNPHPLLKEIGGIIKTEKSPTTALSKVKDAIADAKASGADTSTAKYLIDGAGKTKKDPVARAAIKQGFDEGVVATIKGSTKADKLKMTRMLDIFQKAQSNARFARLKRPSDVVGETILDRFKTVQSINKEAGQNLKKVAQTLKGKKVDHGRAMESFFDDLDRMDIGSSFNPKTGLVEPNFSGSMIEGLGGPESAIKRVFMRLNKGGENMDAFDIHRMKKYIDEQVTFGKSAEGLGGETERVLKNLRRNLDGVLDEAFPKYNAVNTKYADTISALDAFQDAAGSKFNVTSANADKFVGTLSRRLMGNAQTRGSLLDSLDKLQSTGKKYGADFEGDIISQAMFFDEIERMFGSSAPQSFQGGIEKATKTALETVSGKRGLTESAIDATAKAAEKMRGISTKEALKSMRALLSSSQ